MRRKRRRYESGASKKGIWYQWRSSPTVRVGARVGNQRSRGLKKVVHGAERSCAVTARRKRGLRRGKSRSRGCQPRRTSPPATSSKAQSPRVVNHSGRKFIWARVASNKLRADCEKLNKISSGNWPRYEGFPQTRTRREVARRNMKLHCLAKWTRLHKQATVSGIQPVAAFHDSFWKYLLVETSRGDRVASTEGFAFILAGLDSSGSVPDQVIVEKSGRRNKPMLVGGSSLASTRKRACRRCGYVGSSHDWDGCSVKLGAPSKAKRGGRPLRRR